MKPDWDKLAEEYAGSTNVLIADVDCTQAGKSLCDKHGVQGYPTIKTFGPGDDEGEKYEGDRSLDAFKKHAASLGPTCGLEHKEMCSPQQLVDLEKFAAMSTERRNGRLVKLQNALKVQQREHDQLEVELKQRFEASKKHLEDLQKKYNPIIKLIRAATPAA